MWCIEKTRISIAAFALCLVAHGYALAQAKQYLDAGKGQAPFDVTVHAIPTEEILNGGPPKDGIPALNKPKFISASDADKFLKKHDRILALEYNGLSHQDSELARGCE